MHIVDHWYELWLYYMRDILILIHSKFTDIMLHWYNYHWILCNVCEMLQSIASKIFEIVLQYCLDIGTCLRGQQDSLEVKYEHNCC